MKAFYLNYRILSWLYVCPPKEPISPWMKFRSILLASIVIITFIIISVLSAISTRYNFPDNLEIALFSISHLVPTVTQFYTLIVAYLLRDELAEIFPKYQRIIDKCKFS